MATTEVILRTKVKNLGSEADIVKVKAGFANNFLVPQGKAYPATEENKKHLEDLQVARQKREQDELADAEKISSRIKKLKPVFELETGQGGKAFGSVTSMDLHKKLEEAGIDIDRHIIKLDQPI
ncbi:MAG: 50S ribosomal protein L9, partial [Verrucomicrobiota bacterium JB023]|nr:50S ribosomal protein L9 [Verrucomicrobiota bacterium JB023]